MFAAELNCTFIVSQLSQYSTCFTGGATLYNGAFLFLVLWSILHRDSEEAPLMYCSTSIVHSFM
ncbi:hypothetical protein E2C01_015989 [Portunus trituberculatus]|uniref:Uncharacterized protein n=1 Tax=Portunus trituberculatus TaxID=210409 RepID=A0A5B7DPD1_PORTR|nr:hypothetical protein [Portunus trituberculatus]